MALNENENVPAAPEATPSTPIPPPAPPPTDNRTSPAWAVPLYVLGLALVYLGERVFSELENGRWYASGLGLSAVAISTFIRFSPRFRMGGARKEIENTLALLSLAGLAGVVLYFSTTDDGMALLTLDRLELPVRERITGVVRIVWVSLVWLTLVPMVFAELALYPMRHAEQPESRRVRAAAASGLILAMAAVYGGLFVFSADAADIKADFSYFKTSKPSEATINVAKKIKGPVRIIGFFPEVNEVKAEVAQYLNALVVGIPNIKVEFKDRLLYPKVAEQFRAFKDGEIILAKGSENEKFDLLNTDISSQSTRDNLKKLDQKFQEVLLKLVRTRRTVYLTVGHGEINDGDRSLGIGRGALVVRKLLENQNYAVRDLGITQGLGKDVPEDADVVLVLGPAEPFAPEELASLRRYVERGGKLLMALDPDRTTNRQFALVKNGDPTKAADATKPGSAPNGAPEGDGSKPKAAEAGAAPMGGAEVRGSLQELAELAGLTLTPALLNNATQHLAARYNKSDQLLMYTSSFSSHASVSTLSRNAPRAALIVGGSGSLQRAKDAKGDINFTVRSMSGTFADENGDYTKQDTEKAEVFNMAAAVTLDLSPKPAPKPDDKAKSDDKSKATQPEKKEARIFVSADADVYTDTFLAQFNANQAYLYDAFRWLGGEESFAGQQSTEEDVRIQHSRKEDTAVFYSTIFGFPALVLGGGLLVSRRSRRRITAKG
ncbi:MAG: Gldg family protein [Polyangiaceae bacterium]|nr:Gldg family protein [Polyangiaceae bacterium]